MRDGTNLRDDEYGGTVENRLRLLRETAEAVAAVAGPSRTAVRLSPNGEVQGCNDRDPATLFPAAAAMLARIGISFLELREPTPEGTFGKPEWPPIAPAIRARFPGPLVLNSDYGFERAQETLDEGLADAIAFGRLYIANPDLVERFATGAPIAGDDQATWYSQGAEGYIDYPRVEARAA